MGPLIREQQRQRVLGYVDKGVREGATVALGGGIPAHLPKGYFVEPTVLADVDPDATVAKRMRTGTVNVNGGVFYGMDVPFGGYRHSGIGREMGVAGFEEYLEIKSLAEKAS